MSDRLLVNLFAMVIIICSVNNKPVLKLFENKYVCYIGKISYGIYLYHIISKVIIFSLVSRVMPIDSVNQDHGVEVLIFIVYMLLLFIISHLSFKYFERPFLKWKEKFK